MFIEQCRPIGVARVNAAVAAVATAAGLGRVTPHQLRHTLATQAINRGMSLEAIAALLGHRSMHMTLTYARIADRTVADEYFAVSEKVEALYDQSRELPADAEGRKMARLRREMHERMLGNELVPSAIDEFGLDAIRGEVQRLWDLWELRDRWTDGTVFARSPIASAVGDHDGVRETDGDVLVDVADEHGGAAISPEAWEATLGALVAGIPVDGALADQLESDPGLTILRELSAEIRASVLVSTLKLTCRLLMLWLGQQEFDELLASYRTRVTPQPFGSDEAERFAAHVHSLALDLPYLDEVIQFDLAVVRTLADGVSRTTRFGFEPISVLRALGEGRLPGPPVPGVFEITVTGEEPTAHLDEYLARANYWPH